MFLFFAWTKYHSCGIGDADYGQHNSRDACHINQDKNVAPWRCAVNNISDLMQWLCQPQGVCVCTCTRAHTSMLKSLRIHVKYFNTHTVAGMKIYQ